MKVSIHDIRETPTVATFAEEASELNALLQHGVRDYVANTAVGVRVSYYRAGLDVFVDGEFWAELEASCARCLAEYPLRLARVFSLVLAPASEMGPGGEDTHRELTIEDLALSFYSGDEIDLSHLVREQLLLTLPTRPLCDAACRGLCPQCGANLNSGDCGCVTDRGDARLHVLRSFKVGG